MAKKSTKQDPVQEPAVDPFDTTAVTTVEPPVVPAQPGDPKVFAEHIDSLDFDCGGGGKQLLNVINVGRVLTTELVNGATRLGISGDFTSTFIRRAKNSPLINYLSPEPGWEGHSFEIKPEYAELLDAYLHPGNQDGE